MLTPEQYQALNNAVEIFDKFIREHPEVVEKAFEEYCEEEEFVDVSDIALGDKKPFGNLKPAEIPTELHTYSYKTIRDCHKCVYEVGCHGNPVGCKRYKRDAPDGGYYG